MQEAFSAGDGATDASSFELNCVTSRLLGF